MGYDDTHDHPQKAGYVNDKTFCTWQIHIRYTFTVSIVIVVVVVVIVVIIVVVVGWHRTRRGQGSHLT